MSETHTDTVRCEPEAALAKERQAFERQRPDLLRQFKGQFVGLYGGRIVGHGLNDEVLAGQLYAELGEVPFYIARVEETPFVYEMPSPEAAG